MGGDSVSKQRFLIVDKSILPDYYEKVIRTRQLLSSGAVREVSAAVRITGISRSTYYKYKDFIFEPEETASGRKAVFLMTLAHEAGTLSGVLSLFSEMGANIISITQSPPIHEKASVTLTADVSRLKQEVNDLLRLVGAIPGVEQSRLLAIE